MNVSAFAGTTLIASGALADVAAEVKRFTERDDLASVLVFDDETSRVVDLDLRGSVDEVIARLAEPKAGPGRPKLGVVAREVTLLPRHWEWLASQRGGASVTLRRLVDEARKTSGDRDLLRRAQETTHRFMTAMAGDLPGFEDALRALYAGDSAAFAQCIKDWPQDLRAHTLRLSQILRQPPS